MRQISAICIAFVAGACLLRVSTANAGADAPRSADAQPAPIPKPDSQIQQTEAEDDERWEGLADQPPEIRALWHRAIRLQSESNWDGMLAALEEITRKKPDFDYACRFYAFQCVDTLARQNEQPDKQYSWVKRGIEIILKGHEKNPTNFKILFDVGYFMSRKVGRTTSLRQSFANDTNLHKLLTQHVKLENGLGFDGKPDNYLVASLFFLKFEALADKVGPPQDMMPIPLLYSWSANCRIWFAEAIEDEGTFGEQAKRAWAEAAKTWEEFGRREIPIQDGMAIRLTDAKTYSGEKASIARKASATTGYESFKARCDVEQKDEVISAREKMYLALREQEKRGNNRSDVTTQTAFQVAFQAWADAIAKNPVILDLIDVLDEYLKPAIEKYRKQFGELPEDFPLRNVLQSTKR